MPRVLFVQHRTHPSGAVRSLAALVKGLSDNWEAHVIMPAGGGVTLLESVGATVHVGSVPAFTHTWDTQYRGLRWLVAAREAGWLPAHVRQLRRLIFELQPAVVHINEVVMLASGVAAARRGIPVVWHLRSSLPLGGNDRRSRIIVRTIDRHAAAAVAIDRDVATTYQLRIPLEVIPNPVEIDGGPPARLNAPEGRVTIGFFGYLRRQKGWPEFLDAIRELVDRGSPAHAVVVGGGVRAAEIFRGVRGRLLEASGIPNEEEAFSRRMAELRLEDHVTWLPFTSNPGSVLRALDIVVFPNQGTGLGRPVLEAAAYGKPVVASGSVDGGGILMPDETGFLIPRGDHHALADALDRLVRDDALRVNFGSAALEHASNFNPNRVASQVEDVWERAISAKQ